MFYAPSRNISTPRNSIMQSQHTPQIATTVENDTSGHFVVALSKEVGQIEAGNEGKMTWKFPLGKKCPNGKAQ